MDLGFIKLIIGENKMITKIPEGQICQAFDPRMIQTNENLKRHKAYEQPNTSCLAPAYVYVEGKHGKKFLCDSHYAYEIRLNRESYSAPNHSWKEIQQFIIDERERVKETFAKNVTTTETLGHKCCLTNYFNQGQRGCEADALVIIKIIKLPTGKLNWISTLNVNDLSQDFFYCNFHFRRTYYRYINNGIVFEDYFKIVDERYRMTMTIAEEAERLTYM
jgi:hypothetical protein